MILGVKIGGTTGSKLELKCRGLGGLGLRFLCSICLGFNGCVVGELGLAPPCLGDGLGLLLCTKTCGEADGKHGDGLGDRVFLGATISKAGCIASVGEVATHGTNDSEVSKRGRKDCGVEIKGPLACCEEGLSERPCPTIDVCGVST